MKLLSSSSVSTITTTSFEGNAYTSKVSCISGMLRRLLMCSSTHASAEADGPSSLGVCEREPGVVARLMGLESMPPCSTTSISREIESTKVLRNHSFREPPTFLELEDENYFILSFESREIVNEMQASKQRSRRNEKQSVYPVKKENLHVNYKLDDQVIIIQTATQNFQKHKDSTNILQPTHISLKNRPSIGMEVVKSPKSIKLIKQDTEGEIRITRRRKKKKCEIFAAEKPLSESDSEKSSPNSVLDFVETQNSEKSTNSRSRRTLSEELENYRKLNLIGYNNGIEKKRSSEGICGELWKKDKNNVLLWRCIYRLAERESVERTWVQKEICKCNEIGWAIGLEILDHMLEELVDQLILHM